MNPDKFPSFLAKTPQVSIAASEVDQPRNGPSDEQTMQSIILGAVELAPVPATAEELKTNAFRMNMLDQKRIADAARPLYYFDGALKGTLVGAAILAVYSIAKHWSRK